MSKQIEHVQFLSTCRTNEQSCCKRSWCGRLCRHVERSLAEIACLYRVSWYVINELTRVRICQLLSLLMRQKFWWALQSLTRRYFSSASYPPKRGRLQIHGRTQHDRTWRRCLRFFAIVAMTTADKLSLSSSSASMF